MIRITAKGSNSFGGRHYQIVAQCTLFKCCNAASHLQHKVRIPNSWVCNLVRIAKLLFRRTFNVLENLSFLNLARSML
jgi:hypothetical protein